VRINACRIEQHFAHALDGRLLAHLRFELFECTAVEFTGLALFQASCRWFRRHGLTSFGLWVVVTNAGARRFYERQGGIAAATRSEILRGERIDEIAYLWERVPGV